MVFTIMECNFCQAYVGADGITKEGYVFLLVCHKEVWVSNQQVAAAPVWPEWVTTCLSLLKRRELVLEQKGKTETKDQTTECCSLHVCVLIFILIWQFQNVINKMSIYLFNVGYWFYGLNQLLIHWTLSTDKYLNAPGLWHVQGQKQHKSSSTSYTICGLLLSIFPLGKTLNPKWSIVHGAFVNDFFLLTHYFMLKVCLSVYIKKCFLNITAIKGIFQNGSQN